MAKLDRRDRSAWLDHLGRWALREPPGCKGRQGHRGSRARRVTLDRPDQLACQVPRVMRVKKEPKASAVKQGHRARLEWLDRPDQSACWVLKATKAIQVKEEPKASAAKLGHRDRWEWLDNRDQSA